MPMAVDAPPAKTTVGVEANNAGVSLLSSSRDTVITSPGSGSVTSVATVNAGTSLLFIATLCIKSAAVNTGARLGNVPSGTISIVTVPSVSTAMPSLNTTAAVHTPVSSAAKTPPRNSITLVPCASTIGC